MVLMMSSKSARRSSRRSWPSLSGLLGTLFLGGLMSISFNVLLWDSVAAAGGASSGSNSALLLPSVFSTLFLLGWVGALLDEAELLTPGLVGVVLGSALLFSGLVQDIAILACRGALNSDGCANNAAFYAANSGYCVAVSALTITVDVALLIGAVVGAVYIQRLQRTLRQATLPASSPLPRDSGKVAWGAKGYANILWTKPRLATIPELDETPEKP